MTTSMLIELLNLPDAVPARGEGRRGIRFAERSIPEISWFDERGYAESSPREVASLESLLTAKTLIRAAIDRGIARQGMVDVDSEGWPKKVS
jgi:hypothetical protein